MKWRFAWDKHKAATNLRKHGISFEEASTVFDNPLAQLVDDEEHAADEQREIIIGHSFRYRLLVTSFVRRASYLIRIISSRLATKREQRDYEENTYN